MTVSHLSVVCAAALLLGTVVCITVMFVAAQRTKRERPPRPRPRPEPPPSPSPAWYTRTVTERPAGPGEGTIDRIDSVGNPTGGTTD